MLTKPAINKLCMPCCRSGTGSSPEEDSEDSGADKSDGEAETDNNADDDADDFQQPAKHRPARSVYEVDVSDSEHASDSDAPAARPKQSHRTLRGNAGTSNPAAVPARRQPSRTAAVKASLAETSSDSSQDNSSDDNDRGSNRKRSGLGSTKVEAKRQKAVEEDSDDSMQDADRIGKDLGLISDSDAMSEDGQDKENQPAAPDADAVR